MAKRFAGAGDPRCDYSVRIGERPGIWDGSPDHGRSEPVGYGHHRLGRHGTQWRDPAREVAHPEATEPDLARRLDRLSSEVDDGMDRLDRRPEATSQSRG